MAAVTSRDELIDHCFRRLGAPVLEINVDEEQVEDRIDDALQMYNTFHADSTVKVYLQHALTQDDIDNEWIPISANVMWVNRLFPIASSAYGGMFSAKYQMHLNDVFSLSGFSGGGGGTGWLSEYSQTMQFMATLSMTMNSEPQVNFVRKQNRLYLHGIMSHETLEVGDYVIAQTEVLVDSTQFPEVWDDMWLKKYATALIKKQWGQNMSKFEGMQLPGGVILNGLQILNDALEEITTLEEELRLTYELPIDFFVG